MDISPFVHVGTHTQSYASAYLRGVRPKARNWELREVLQATCCFPMLMLLPGVVNLADIGSLEDSVWKVKFKVPGLRDVQCFTLSLRSPKAKKARKCSCKL